MSLKALQICVYGRVQGVFFRKSTLDKARSLKLSGWVRNEPDGSVYMHVQGYDAAVDQLYAWCFKGSTTSRVDRVVVSETELIETDHFYIQK